MKTKVWIVERMVNGYHGDIESEVVAVFEDEDDAKDYEARQANAPLSFGAEYRSYSMKVRPSSKS